MGEMLLNDALMAAMTAGIVAALTAVRAALLRYTHPLGRPPTLIAEVRDGARVKVVGRIEAPSDPLRAPVTGLPCVVWQLNRLDARGVPLDRPTDARCCEFDVRDDTGVARISATNDLRLYADAKGGPVFSEETYLAVGEVIAIEGVACWEGDGDAYRSMRRLRLVPPLLITNRPLGVGSSSGLPP